MDKFLTQFHDMSMKKLALGTPCPYCNIILTEENISLDHVVPKSSGIKIINSHQNLIFCCVDCNNKKGNTSLLEFLGLVIDLQAQQKFARKAFLITRNKRLAILKELTGLRVTISTDPKVLVINFYLKKNKQSYAKFRNYDLALAFAKRYKLSQLYAKGTKNG